MGVIFTLVVALLFFLVYVKSLNIALSIDHLFKDYILFITSFPKLSLDKYSTFNSIWYVSLIIWLSRIFITYGIYQTVAAFRKYGKT